MLLQTLVYLLVFYEIAVVACIPGKFVPQSGSYISKYTVAETF